MSGSDEAGRAAEILSRMQEAYPDARVELRHRNAFELLVATILSAQCTDVKVNEVTEVLFDEYPGPEELAAAERERVEEIVRPTGFFRQKAASIRECSRMLVEEFDGEVPTDLDDLTRLPGVGRKTGNVIRAGAFGLPGIGVDTHCKRVSRRLELTERKTPDAIEKELMELYPESDWAEITRLFIWHGRYTCVARQPRCEECVLADLCPWYAEHRG